MKTLILMRHAKSSWDHPGLRDIERPLNARGERDAPLMAGLFEGWGIRPDLLVASPAVRAQTTARLVGKVIGSPESAIRTEPKLYECGVSGILATVHGLPKEADTVCLFGHNPDFSDAAGFLAGEGGLHMPTASLVSLIFAVDEWEAIMPGTGRINRFEYPKRHL
jgi:phosphohistidine phosphatase